MKTNVRAATSIVDPRSAPDRNATIGIHIPIIRPKAPTISMNPVRKLKNDGIPNRLNSLAIFPEIIVVPVNIKKYT